MKKKILLITLIFLSSFADTFAQCAATAIAGGGTSGNARCPMTRYRNARSHYLITAAEMAAAGYGAGDVISGISWNYSTSPTVSASGNLIVYLQNTSDVTNLKSTSWPVAITGMQTAHSAVTTLPAAAGFFNITFSGGTPFTYTGGGIYVAFDWDYCAGTLDAVGVVGCSTALVNGLFGAQNAGACLAPTVVAASSFRPDTRFISTVVNDVKVDYIYTIGEMPVGYSSNHAVSAKITNRSNAALTNFNVNLNILGANTFTNVQTIATLAACASQTVTFLPFTPASAGTDTVRVILPPDNNNANNTKDVLQQITYNRYNYRYGGEAPATGVGFNAATGAVTARFTTNAPLTLTHVNVQFSTTGQTYKIAIYPDNAGVPALSPIYVDATDRLTSLVASDQVLASPVVVPAGNFYVGIQQTGVVNAGIIYATETPLRTGTFHFASPLPVAAWGDLGPANGFRPLLGVKFCHPYAPDSVYGNTPVCQGSTNTYSVTPMPEATSYTWTLPGGWTGSSVTNTISATAGNTSGNVTCVANYICGASAGKSLAVTVNPAPVVNANPGVTNVCTGNQATLFGSGTAVSYTWSGGISDNVAFTPAASDIYTVTGVGANGCSATSAASVIVNPYITGTGSATPSTICLGNNTTINASATTLCPGSINNFAGIYAPANWTNINMNSNGTVNTAGAPANIIMTSGTNLSGTPGNTNYSIAVGCTGNITLNWSYTHPDAFGSIFDFPQYSINGGAPVTFPGFVNGGSNTQSGSATIPVNANDVFQFQMYTLDNDAVSGTVTISSFTAPAAPVNGTVSIWDSPAGGINLGNPPLVVTPAMAGTVNYYVEITSNAPASCVNPVRVAVPVTVNGLPTVTASPVTQTVCENGMATVSGGGAASYTWTGGITDATPFTVVAPAIYTVTGTDANGCTNTATAEVLMNAAPLVSASATPNTTCNMTSVTPNATGANSYVWSGGLMNGVPFVALATATYTVTGTDGGGCTATSTVTVAVNPASGVLAPATSIQAQDHGDDFNINYYDGACDLIATVDDGAGGNILGLTTSTVNVDATAGFHNGQPFVRRWYQVTPTNNGSADVVLYINQSDFDDYNAAVAAPYLPLPTSGNNADPNVANIRITKNDDAGLGNNPIVITPTVNWNGTYWELSFNTPSFSQFRVHSVNPGNVPLPATVINFIGTKLESSDKLSWTTASEQNNAYFNLQHSTDGMSFRTIAKVNSKAVNGNSTSTLNYSSVNDKPVLGHNYYRLQQVDIDNKVSVHAQVVDLIWGATGSSVSIYPNPTTDIVNVDLYSVKATNTTVKLLDMSGRVIKQIQAQSVIGMNNIQLSMGEIAGGVYTIQVYENNTLTHTGKVRKNAQ